MKAGDNSRALNHGTGVLEITYKAAITLWERLYTIKDNSANYECQLTGAAVSEVILTPDGKWVSPKAGK